MLSQFILDAYEPGRCYRPMFGLCHPLHEFMQLSGRLRLKIKRTPLIQHYSQMEEESMAPVCSMFPSQLHTDRPTELTRDLNGESSLLT